MASGKVLDDHARLGCAEGRRNERGERCERNGLRQLLLENDRDPDRRERTAGHASDAQALEAVRGREERRRHGHQGQRDRAHPGRCAHEAPVQEGVRPGEPKQPEEDRPGERPAARERDVPHSRVREEQQRRGAEAQRRPLERRQLAVAEAHGDEVEPCDDDGYHERGEGGPAR